jgi:hypothetical protein
MTKEDGETLFTVFIIIIAVGIGLGLFAYLFLLGLKAFVGPTATTTMMFTAALPVLEAGAGLAATAYTVNIVVKQYNKAQKEPYKWLLPIMGILAAFTIDVLKEIIVKMKPGQFEGAKESIVTAAVAGITALTYFGGGLLWQFETTKKANVVTKVIAVILFLLPLLCTYVYFISTHSNRELGALIMDLRWDVIAPLGLFLLLFVVTLVLGYKYRR